VFCGFELRGFGRVDDTMPICICSCSRFALCVVFSLSGVLELPNWWLLVFLEDPFVCLINLFLNLFLNLLY